MTHGKIVLTHGNMDKKMHCLDIIWLYYNYLCAMNDYITTRQRFEVSRKAVEIGPRAMLAIYYFKKN